MKKITLTQAIEGYELAATARHLSPNTLNDYRNTFKKFVDFISTDLPVHQITQRQVEEFLASQTVSNKSILNYHTSLSALYTWCQSEGLVPENILHRIPRPKPQKPVIIPFTETDIRAILTALTSSRIYARPGKKASRHSLPDADRNRAIVLLLIDTGIRASELCDLVIHRVDLRNPDKSITVHGKGNKDRRIPISARTAQSIWKYLATRPESRLDDPLFATANGRHIDRTSLGKILAGAGDRCGIIDVHPHRFRHTFAINYLRNGGDIYTLQMILGHTTLDMVKTYLQIAQSDLETAHRRASPVDHWRL